MKNAKVIIAALAVAFLAACGGNASAGTPTSVADTSGQNLYPTEPALSIEKDTASGNRVKVNYPSGFRYVEDDRAWSRYALLKGGLTRPVDAPTSTTALSIDTAKAFITCSQNQTYINWPSSGGTPITLNDNCAFRNAAKN